MRVAKAEGNPDTPGPEKQPCDRAVVMIGGRIHIENCVVRWTKHGLSVESLPGLTPRFEVVGCTFELRAAGTDL